jgi:putative SOS response-associated peptidase YedK
MCSRFTLTEDDRDFLAARLGVAADALANYRPRYNIAPQQDHFIVTTEYENRKLAPAKWGLVSDRGKHRSAIYSINAKAETAESRTTFAEAFAHRRCVIPADGFYEWTGPKHARQPFWIHRRDGELLLYAGLYQMGTATTTSPQASFTILTCAANSALATLHDRMPVILSERNVDDWMNPREKAPRSLKRLLLPAAEDLLVIQPASPLVNSVRNEGPQLLAGCRFERQLLFNF